MTDSQLIELKELFVNDMIESMDMDTLIEFAFDKMMENYSDMSEEEFREEVIYFSEESFYNDLVDRVSDWIISKKG